MPKSFRLPPSLMVIILLEIDQLLATFLAIQAAESTPPWQPELFVNDRL